MAKYIIIRDIATFVTDESDNFVVNVVLLVLFCSNSGP